MNWILDIYRTKLYLHVHVKPISSKGYGSQSCDNILFILLSLNKLLCSILVIWSFLFNLRKILVFTAAIQRRNRHYWMNSYSPSLGCCLIFLIITLHQYSLIKSERMIWFCFGQSLYLYIRTVQLFTTVFETLNVIQFIFACLLSTHNAYEYSVCFVQCPYPSPGLIK